MQCGQATGRARTRLRRSSRGRRAFRTRRVLRWNFADRRTSLVMKSDAGSALVAWEVDRLSTIHRTLRLRSSMRAPRYDDSCEAWIGSLEVQNHMAAQHRLVAECSSDAIESFAAFATRSHGCRASAHGTASGDRVLFFALRNVDGMKTRWLESL